MNPLTQTEFYDRLAEFFDVMTDWPARLAVELPFLQATLARFHAHRVWDCACGTGWHAIALAQQGYAAVGSDASSGMVLRALANADHQSVHVPFSVVDWEALRAAEPVDAVLCLGNSFPHVLAEDAAVRSLAAMHNVLHPDGVLILHNLNYDKRWHDKPRWFNVNSGVLDHRETIVWRFADYGENRVTFNIALFTRAADGSWSVQVQSTLQQPYQRADLERLARTAGFRQFEFYGSLQGEPFDPAQSPDLVLVAVA